MPEQPWIVAVAVAKDDGGILINLYTTKDGTKASADRLRRSILREAHEEQPHRYVTTRVRQPLVVEDDLRTIAEAGNA